ncbi:PREDICTED: mitochondrial substrate carrier family protein ucpB isoform X3 [Erythranthe guttata]|uniref:mitochondrial substrate carrier family protein ucpB isoform X3 n=1 Tax=Erythranthe guttata TaxID=4155 RepID=UPI00064DF3D6|nr:PREDICTED: mitochondrial substrate carrier family protein ucpB isoform X3 [Erythranthe guttata]|eukprot:XP_012832868.1 PREDICTED: mitochondrial substrate carrier family protein ucpB isoform X3 [Erythranthe guttata]
MAGDSSPGSFKAKWGVSPSDVFYHFGTSGMSVAAATAVTHPLDVLKVRLQMQRIGQRGPLIGMGKLSMEVVKSEGPRSLYLGLTPALMRLQMNTKVKSGPVQEFRKIASEEGVAALWKGVGPAMTRAAALTASQLATYDESKLALMKCTSMREGFYLHLTASIIAGAVSTVITAPIDMVKTRLMMQRESKRAGNYKSGFHCAYQVLLTEGPRGLYKGGFALFARLGPQTTITLILCEKLRELTGLKAL